MEETTRGDAGLPPPSDRYFEDYHTGKNYPLGSFALTGAEIVDFATLYDPQPMHLLAPDDPALIASGWQTACLSMRLIADNYLSKVAGLPSPGLEELRWHHPVHAGEVIDLHARIESSRVSNTRPDRGIVRTTFIATNVEGREVMSFRAVSFVRRRPEDHLR